jgi:fimbrial isopeptide formation D2 family protein/LPXTG-motif cell wall-anchored protein
VAAATTTVTLSVDPGYYFIDSSLGAVCALTDAGENFTEIEKNTQPTITKKIVDGEDAVASTSRKIGDIVTFQLTVSVATTSPDTTYKVVDTMTDGLELVETSIKINGVDATDNDTNYTLTTGTQTFTIEFTNDYVKRYTSETITIAYDAKITKSAVQTGEDGNLVIKALNNKVVLYYGDTYTVGTGDTEVNIYNGNINIYKYDAKDDTEGSKTPLVATFVLMNDQSKYLIADWNTNDADASDWTDDLTQALHITTQDDGTASVEGLAYGTYYLREITAPQGYNLLATDVEITISGTTVTTLNLTENVPNSTGTTLPSTGGIGTTIFYVVGGILVLGAGIVLVTKKRMANR